MHGTWTNRPSSSWKFWKPNLNNSNIYKQVTFVSTVSCTEHSLGQKKNIPVDGRRATDDGQRPPHLWESRESDVRIWKNREPEPHFWKCCANMTLGPTASWTEHLSKWALSCLSQQVYTCSWTEHICFSFFEAKKMCADNFGETIKVFEGNLESQRARISLSIFERASRIWPPYLRQLRESEPQNLIFPSNMPFGLTFSWTDCLKTENYNFGSMFL